ncbi:uncharacterized protein [Periplaneta americana]|uniref:uncharacterized protein n=1 Tax=Periplaneta americana TaxID=6978 RepID=UPI0037E803DD
MCVRPGPRSLSFYKSGVGRRNTVIVRACSWSRKTVGVLSSLHQDPDVTMAMSRVHMLKFVELALTVICVALHYHSNEGRSFEFYEFMITCAAFGGYLVILIGVLVGIFTSTPINKRIDIFYSLVGCALFIAAGSFVIEHYDHYPKGKTRDTGLSKGAMAIINGVVFFVDALLSFRGE